MKRDLSKKIVLLVGFVFTISIGFTQQKGNLFIIGGGSRSVELLEALVKTADLAPDDYIVILPMSSGVPVESVEVISKELSGQSKNAIADFNFTRTQAKDHQTWIDSVRNAKLIYITGGDQNRFMEVVRGTRLYDALHEAYNKGATIAGTSAGAAVMSRIMITGEEKDKKNSGKEIKSDNIVTSEGMGFITTAIIDQHFIWRSRYNRLLSVLGDHPDKMVIGIDEGTAIVVKGKKASVVGESQVVVVSSPKKLKKSAAGKISFKKARLALLISGDHFKI